MGRGRKKNRLRRFFLCYSNYRSWETGNTDWMITCQSVNKSIKVACENSRPASLQRRRRLFSQATIKVACVYLVSKLSRENVSAGSHCTGFSWKWRITKKVLSRVCKEKLPGLILKPEQKEGIIFLLRPVYKSFYQMPELSRTMAYTTRKTVNRLACKQLHLILWCQKYQRRNSLYIELEKHKLDQIAARNIRMSLDKRIAFSR